MSSKQFAVIIVITFIVGIIWLVSDIIFNTKASIPDNPKLNTLLEPINPNFNPRVLKLIDEEIPITASIPVSRGSGALAPPETATQTSTRGGQIRP